MKYLINKGIDINAVNVQEDTPLNLSIDYGKYLYAEYLLMKGANPNIQNKSGFLRINLAYKRELNITMNLSLDNGSELYGDKEKIAFFEICNISTPYATNIIKKIINYIVEKKEVFDIDLKNKLFSLARIHFFDKEGSPSLLEFYLATIESLHQRLAPHLPP